MTPRPYQTALRIRRRQAHRIAEHIWTEYLDAEDRADPKTALTVAGWQQSIRDHLAHRAGVSVPAGCPEDLWNAVALNVRNRLAAHMKETLGIEVEWVEKIDCETCDGSGEVHEFGPIERVEDLREPCTPGRDLVCDEHRCIDGALACCYCAESPARLILSIPQWTDRVGVECQCRQEAIRSLGKQLQDEEKEAPATLEAVG